MTEPTATDQIEIYTMVHEELEKKGLTPGTREYNDAFRATLERLGYGDR